MKAIRRRWQCNAVVCYTLSRGCLGALSIMGRKLPGCPTSRITEPALVMRVQGFVSRKKGARSMVEEKKEGEKKNNNNNNNNNNDNKIKVDR